MASSLSWLDHDAEARDRSLRILALFQEKESRDELGLGGIRDSFADRLFPGTSTIQTRLRYLLFVPWIYQALEKQRVSAGDFARRADQAERDLIDTMRNADDRGAGVFGGRSGRQLKRLPSSVYWAGLGSWGIRAIDLSQDQYHRQIGLVYRRRLAQTEQANERARNGDDGERAAAPGTVTWHPRLPPSPGAFPSAANFNLTAEEASFLLDRLQRSHPDSLLAYLALRGEPVEVDAPWQHPDSAAFSAQHRDLLDQGRRFSEVMHGAAIVYNIALAEARGWEEKTEEHRERLRAWFSTMELSEVRGWSFGHLWELTVGHGHTITPATRRFVEGWVDLLTSFGEGVADAATARRLIRHREMELKKPRSRFTNPRALDQWGGTSGLGRMTYRWSTASTFLSDLHAGLTGGSG
jgi:hypothetical protein